MDQYLLRNLLEVLHVECMIVAKVEEVIEPPERAAGGKMAYVRLI